MTIEETFDPIQARRDEVAAYDQNIATYTAIYAGLPHEWPEHLAPYRGRKDQHSAIDEIEDLDDVTLLSQLWYADTVHNLIRTETLERTKAAAILAALEGAA
jgi:hypothetical protein